jgi:hypothetical protein
MSNLEIDLGANKIDIDILGAQASPTNVYSAIKAAETKASIVNNDGIVITDSQSSDTTKRVLWSSVKTVLRSVLDFVYSPIAHAHTGVYEPYNENIQEHISDTENPHEVTKTQVGLGNVPNVDCRNADNITSGTLDGDRLPAVSTTKKGGVPATGTPSGKFLKDDGAWAEADKVRINADDTTSGYLQPKLLEGVDGIKINTDSDVEVSTGVIKWNPTDGTFDMGLKNGSVLQAGQELYFYGQASGAIANGDLCQFAGVFGNHVKVKKAVASEIRANPDFLLGVSTENISNGQYGYITWFGKVNNVSTGDWSMGDVLYFDNTTGGLTNIEPVPPNLRISVAAVVKESTGAAENGVLIVRPQKGIRFVDCDDVNGTPLTTDGQFPIWHDTEQYFDFTHNIFDITLKRVRETAANTFTTTLSPSSGVLTVDTSLKSIVYGQLNASVTKFALTNVEEINGTAATITLILNGNTSYTYGSSVSINGTDISGGIKWESGVSPFPSTGIDRIMLTVVRDSGGTTKVLGTFSNYV